MEEEKGLVTYVCDECGKVIESVYYDGETNELDKDSISWLNVYMHDVLSLALLFELNHRADHLCEDCKEKIIYKAKEALMELGFEEEEEI